MEQKKEREDKWLLCWKVLYNEHQKSVIDRMMDYCKVNSYNKVAGIKTLLDIADYHKHITVLAGKIVDLEKEVERISKILEQPIEEPETVERPKTMGG